MLRRLPLQFDHSRFPAVRGVFTAVHENHSRIVS